MKSLRTFYRLAAPFWRQRSQWLGWLMLAGIIGMGLLIVQINVLINAWSKAFYDTLGEFDTNALYALMGRYVVYLGAYVVIVVALDWIRKALVLRWRQAMTEHFTPHGWQTRRSIGWALAVSRTTLTSESPKTSTWLPTSACNWWRRSSSTWRRSARS